MIVYNALDRRLHVEAVAALTIGNDVTKIEIIKYNRFRAFIIKMFQFFAKDQMLEINVWMLNIKDFGVQCLLKLLILAIFFFICIKMPI